MHKKDYTLSGQQENCTDHDANFLSFRYKQLSEDHAVAYMTLLGKDIVIILCIHHMKKETKPKYLEICVADSASSICKGKFDIFVKLA